MILPDKTPDPQRIQLVQRLFVGSGPQLRGFILALAPDFTLVDDIMQETFISLQAKVDEFDPQGNFLGWACAFARFKLREALRRRGHEALALSDEVIESLCAALPAPEDDDPRLKTLAHCLEGLAPKARRTVELRYMQAHKPAEVAQRMGWTAPAVYVALSRARAVLRECVERKLQAPSGGAPCTPNA